MKNQKDSIKQQIEQHIFNKGNIHIEVQFNLNDENVIVKTNDFAENMWPRMFKTLTIKNNNSYYHDRVDCYVLVLQLRYEHLDGGFNGCHFLNLFITQEGEVVTHLIDK